MRDEPREVGGGFEAAGPDRETPKHPANHDRSKELHEIIAEKLQKELDTGRMRGPFSEEEVLSFLGIFDWEKAYHQIPTHPSQWRYLMLRTNDDQLILDTRVSFGGVAGCGSFGGPADAWKDIMKEVFGFDEVFRWVDDNLFIKVVGNNNKTTMEDVVAESAELGVKTNEGKYAEFATEQKYIGFIFREIEKLRGRLSHVTYILPQMKCFNTSLDHWMATWIEKRAPRTMPPNVHEDLWEWKRVLKDFTNHRLIPRKESSDIGWVGDAATSHGIGIIIGNRWAQWKLKTGWDESDILGVKRDIAWAETVAVRLGLEMVAKMQDVRGKRFLFLTDNTTTEGVVRNLKSRHVAVNQEWRRIQRRLVELDCDLEEKRVTSLENDTDDLSRGIRIRKYDADRLQVDIPEDLR